MKKKIVIWGAGGHARVVADAITAANEFEIAGFFVDTECRDDVRSDFQHRILGGSNDASRVFKSGVAFCFVGVGNCRRRLELAALLEQCGFSLATVVHPRAILATEVDIGPGTFIAAGAILNPGVVLGRNVIINTGATIDHECKIGAGAHVSPGAHLAGNVTVGQGTWIGIGAAAIDKVTIGANTIIGAGAVVTRNVPDNVIAYGVPAKIVRPHEVALSPQ